MLHRPRNIMRTAACCSLFLAAGLVPALAADPTGDWRVADGVAKPTLAASLEQEVTFQQILVATDDFREAGAAYMEKRPPNFSGAPPGATKRVPEAETA